MATDNHLTRRPLENRQIRQEGRHTDRYIHTQLVRTIILALQIISDVMETITNVGCQHRWQCKLQANLQHAAMYIHFKDETPTE
jgi:hypothetical protein